MTLKQALKEKAVLEEALRMAVDCISIHHCPNKKDGACCWRSLTYKSCSKAIAAHFKAKAENKGGRV